MLLKIVSEYRPCVHRLRLGRPREDLPGRALRPVQGAASLHAGRALGPVEPPAGADGGLRHRQPRQARVRGRRHPRDAGGGGQAPGHRVHRRHRRPRRDAGGRRGHLGDEHRPRRHRRQDLHARRRAGALRRHAGADPRLHRAQGRQLGQHPRRARCRREDRGAAAAAVRLASTSCTGGWTRSRARSGARSSPSTRTTRVSRCSSRRWCWTSRSSTTSSSSSPAAATGCRSRPSTPSSSASSSPTCAGVCARSPARRRPRRPRP